MFRHFWHVPINRRLLTVLEKLQFDLKSSQNLDKSPKVWFSPKSCSEKWIVSTSLSFDWGYSWTCHLYKSAANQTRIPGKMLRSHLNDRILVKLRFLTSKGTKRSLKSNLSTSPSLTPNYSSELKSSTSHFSLIISIISSSGKEFWTEKKTIIFS